MQPKKENLRMWYSFVLVLRVLAYTTCIAGAIIAVEMLGLGIVDAIKAEFHHKDDKIALVEYQKRTNEKADQALAKFRAEEADKRRQLEESSAARIASIESEYHQAVEHFKQITKDFNKALNAKLETLKKESDFTLQELKKLGFKGHGDLSPIQCKNPGITKPEQSKAFATELQAVGAEALSSYKAYMTDCVKAEFAVIYRQLELEAAPHLSKKQELESKIAEIQAAIEAINAAHRGKTEIEYKTVERAGDMIVHPIPNIYGIRSLEAMQRIKNLRKNLPTLSSDIPNDDLIGDGISQNVRKSLMNIMQWLPDVKEGAKKHEREAIEKYVPGTPLTDEEKAELKRLQEELATLQNELRPVDGKLRELENLRSNVTDSESTIMQQLDNVCTGWSLNATLAEVQEYAGSYKQTPPASVKGEVERIRQETQEAINKSLEDVRKAEAAAAYAKQMLAEYVAQKTKAFSNMERELSSVYALKAIILAAELLAGAWLAFYLLLVLADVIVSPMLITLRNLKELNKD